MSEGRHKYRVIDVCVLLCIRKTVEGKTNCVVPRLNRVRVIYRQTFCPIKKKKYIGIFRRNSSEIVQGRANESFPP